MTTIISAHSAEQGWRHYEAFKLLNAPHRIGLEFEPALFKAEAVEACGGPPIFDGVFLPSDQLVTAGSRLTLSSLARIRVVSCPMGLLQRLSNNRDSSSLANAYRRKRFALFQELVRSLDHSARIRILDLGGTQAFWESMGFSAGQFDIYLLNLSAQELAPSAARNHSSGPHYYPIVGDACDLSRFKDGEFDIVFSNSVIEHVGSWENQQRMLREAKRVGKRYFIQTPNFFFPLEPHFLFPGFQFLPFRWRVWLVQRFDLGWFKRAADRASAESLVNSCQLLTRRQLRKLDQQAQIYAEKCLGLTKSFVLYHGW